MMFSLTDILAATGGVLLQGTPGIRVRSVVTDTRCVRKGDLFVAVKGDRFDGHHFLAQAAAGGARVLLVSQRELVFPSDTAVILVKDTVQAYGAIARFHRRRFPGIPVIAITGSAGKTTTKELIAAILKTRYRVLYNKGTENNHIGVPSTLLKLRAVHQVAVIEAGTNHHGEIDWLAGVVEPTCAVFTNVGPSHLAGLGTPQGVFKEKAALADHVSAKGTLIVNIDDRFLVKLLSRNDTRTVRTYAVDQRADVQAQDIVAGPSGMTFRVGREKFKLKDPVPGNIYNALAAIVCGRSLKLTFEEIRRGLARFKAPAGRQQFYRVGAVTVINDAYNANPLSFKNAVSTLKLVHPSGRTVLVAADMLELGDGAVAWHRDVGAFAAEQGIDLILTCGALAKHIGEGALAVKERSQVVACVDKQEVLAVLQKFVSTGDAVLIKGSRGMRMESVVEDLLMFLKG